ncbi:unnamed protein product [Camellia sinensis]
MLKEWNILTKKIRERDEILKEWTDFVCQGVWAMKFFTELGLKRWGDQILHCLSGCLGDETQRKGRDFFKKDVGAEELGF